jgi:tol-pal system protein YbgF
MKASSFSACILLAIVGLGACATKKDVDAIQEELAAVRARQAVIEAGIDSLQRALAYALTFQRDISLTTRGDVKRQLDDMEHELVEIQELLGQSQIVLNNLRERIDTREWRASELAAAIVPDSAGAEPAEIDPGAGGDPRSLYSASIEQFRRGAFVTARTGFEEFLEAYPADELAPDAQYYLAETYKEEDDAERAIREYRRVVELYPNSRTAPTALYKAGLLEVDEGNRDQACQYFQRILAGYPRSDEARLASDQAGRLNCN